MSFALVVHGQDNEYKPKEFFGELPSRNIDDNLGRAVPVDGVNGATPRAFGKRFFGTTEGLAPGEVTINDIKEMLDNNFGADQIDEFAAGKEHHTDPSDPR